MELMEILKGAVDKKASDIFLISGLAVSYKENGIITKESNDIILPAEAERLVKEIYRLAGRDISKYEETGDGIRKGTQPFSYKCVQAKRKYGGGHPCS